MFTPDNKSLNKSVKHGDVVRIQDGPWQGTCGWAKKTNDPETFNVVDVQDYPMYGKHHVSNLTTKGAKNPSTGEILVKEDGDAGGVPCNTAGAGQVAAIGVGAQGEPGVTRNKKHAAIKAILINMMKRKAPTI